MGGNNTGVTNGGAPVWLAGNPLPTDDGGAVAALMERFPEILAVMPPVEPRPKLPDDEELAYWLRDKSDYASISRRQHSGIVTALLSEPRPTLDDMTDRWEIPSQAREWLTRILHRAVVAAGGTRRELEYLRRVLVAAWADADLPADDLDDLDDLDDDPLNVGAVRDAIQDLLKPNFADHVSALVALLVGTLDGASTEPVHPAVSLPSEWQPIAVAIVAAVLADAGRPPSHPPTTHYPGTGLHDPAISAAVVPTGPPATTDRTTHIRVLSVAA